MCFALESRHDSQRRYRQVEATVTLQCSGTRRIEQISRYAGDGDELINAPWGEGAMSVFMVSCMSSFSKILIEVQLCTAEFP